VTRATIRHWLAALLLAAATVAGAGASAQDVVLRGAGEVDLDRRLARLLDGDPLIVSRDTMIAAGDTIHRSVLVLDATIVHEGVILGDLVGVDAGAFVRPYAVVTGDLVNIAGGLYRSEISEVGGRIIDLPTAGYRVLREAGLLVIEATATDSPLELDGLMGLHVPTYDRVNGLTVIWGTAYRLPRIARVEPRVHAQVGWQTQRGDPTYQVDLSLRRGANELSLGHERAWDTNERWIRGDLMNSLGYLWNGGDYRDYHDVERSWAELSRRFADGTRRFRATVAVRGQLEDATSLRAGRPWFLLGSDPPRPNPPIDDGRTTSMVADADVAWNGEQTRFAGRFETEAARQVMGGDFRFGRVRAQGAWAMLAFANHTLAIEYFLQRPLGGETMPRQRWSFVGGANTLHTLPFAEFHGDHVVFVETNYIIPLPDRLALPILGAPRVHLLHAAGMAWTAGDDRPLHQEVGVRLDLGLVFIRYSVVPDDPGVTDLSVGLALPFGRRFPWEN
jgi:hypothetical protein